MYRAQLDYILSTVCVYVCVCVCVSSYREKAKLTFENENLQFADLGFENFVVTSD